MTESGKDKVGKTSSLRSALIIAVCTGLLFFLLFAKKGAPAAVVDLLDSRSISELSIHGGSIVLLSVEGGQASEAVTGAVAKALRGRGAVVVSAQNASILLELPKIDVVYAGKWAEQITAQGKLAMHMVIENSEFMKKAYDLAKEAVDVDADIDQWFHDGTGTGYVDYYLRGDSREELEETMHRWLESGALVLPADAMLAYQHVDQEYAKTNYWRSYLLDSTAHLTDADISNASVYWNPTINKPEVLVEFTREGGRRFADLTGANIGKKLAILVDGDINSAPSIQDRIAGGSTSITMGGNDPRQIQVDAQGFVGALRGPDLPAHVETVAVGAVEPTVSKHMMLAARGLMAVGAGLCAGLFMVLLSLLLGRVTQPLSESLITAVPKGERSWLVTLRPVVVSLGGVLATFALGMLWLPGTEELFGQLGSEWEPQVSAEVSWVAIGLGPFLTGAVLAEGLAFLIPAWRRRRGGDAAARKPIENLALVLALVLLCAQAFFVTRWLATVSGFDTLDTLDMGGLGSSEFSERAALVALLGGSALLYIIARLVSRYGLGNGYALVIMAGMLPLVVDIPEQMTLLSTENTFAFCKVFLLSAFTALACYALIRRCICTRSGGKQTLPLAGVAPILIGPPVLALLVLATRAWEGGVDELLVAGQESFLTVQIVGIVVASLLLTAVALRKPQGSSEVRVVAGVQSTADSRSLVAAVLISIAFPVGLFFVMQSIFATGVGVAISFATLVLGLGLAMDLWGELHARFRNPGLTPVWALQRPRYLLLLTDTLAQYDIEYFVRGRYLRTLLSVVGPFVPMVIMVPKDDVDEALELIRASTLTRD